MLENNNSWCVTESFLDAAKELQAFSFIGANQYMAVYMSAVEHPGHFWVQMVSSKGLQLDRLMQDMTEYYTGLKDGKVTCIINRLTR